MKRIIAIIWLIACGVQFAYATEVAKPQHVDGVPKQQEQAAECIRSEKTVKREDGIEVVQATCCCQTRDGGMCCGACGPFNPQGCTFKCK